MLCCYPEMLIQMYCNLITITTCILYCIRLFELADCIEEVKTTCMYCNSKAVYNLKHVDGKADLHGPVVQLGAEEKYFPTCFKCYRQQILDVDTNFLDLV